MAADLLALNENLASPSGLTIEPVGDIGTMGQCRAHWFSSSLTTVKTSALICSLAWGSICPCATMWA